MRAQLPPQLQELLASAQFAAMCAQQFEALDADKSGKLEPKELIPAIVEMLTPALAAQGMPPPTVEQCLMFAQVQEDSDLTPVPEVKLR